MKSNVLPMLKHAEKYLGNPRNATSNQRHSLTKVGSPGKMKKLTTRDFYHASRAALVPEWRNWQTRQVQDLVLAREWRFESSFGHQIQFLNKSAQ
jgi:hypothetical protein